MVIKDSSLPLPHRPISLKPRLHMYSFLLGFTIVPKEIRNTECLCNFLGGTSRLLFNK